METVPLDVLHYLCKEYLSIRDIVRFSATSSLFRQRVWHSYSLWNYLYRRDVSDLRQLEYPNYIYRKIFRKIPWSHIRDQDEYLTRAIKYGADKMIQRYYQTYPDPVDRNYHCDIIDLVFLHWQYDLIPLFEDSVFLRQNIVNRAIFYNCIDVVQRILYDTRYAQYLFNDSVSVCVNQNRAQIAVLIVRRYPDLTQFVLLSAAIYNKLDLFTRVLQLGPADIRHCFIAAAEYGSIDIIEYLLSQNYQLDLDAGLTAALSRDHFRIALLLHQRGARGLLYRVPLNLFRYAYDTVNENRAFRFVLSKVDSILVPMLDFIDNQI